MRKQLSSPVDVEARRAQLLAAREKYVREIQAAKDADPFWYFEPTTGEITEERMEFLRRHLKDEDIPPRLDGQVDFFRAQAPVVMVSGGNRCLGGESEVYDPVLGKNRRVDSILEDFHVLAWDGSSLVTARAERPFTKGVDDLYRFSLSNGESFVASKSHVVLTSSGWSPLSALRPGCELFLPESTSDTCLSVHAEGGRSFVRIARDSQSGYPAYHHLCDERLLSESGSGQGVAPLQGGARKLSYYAYGSEDDTQHRFLYSQTCQSDGHLSTPDVPMPLEGQFSDTLSDASCTPCVSISGLPRADLLSTGVFSRPQSTGGFVQQAIHIDIPSSRVSSVSSSITSLVVTDIQYVRRDVKYDFTVPVYHNYLLGGAIHHNSGKSVSAAVYAYIWVTGRLPLSLVDVFPLDSLHPERCRDVRVTGVTNKQLMNTVIPAYQKWVPREYLKGGKWTESWSAEQKTLSLYEKGKFIGLIEFMTNEQDVTTFQGPDRGLMIYDEQPREDIRKENLLRMAATTGVKEVFGFTPTEGLTWATDLMAEGEDDAGREVAVVKLVSVTNPKVGVDVLDSIVREITDYSEIKMRLTGAAVSLSGLIYGSLFDAKTHVIAPFFEDLKPEQKKDYMLVTGMDPHGVTPTAMVFMLVDREGNKYVDTCYDRDADTDEVKAAWWRIVKESGYRPGWAVADKSSDTSIIALGGKNIFRLLSRGTNAIPAMRISEKYEGSIRAGVDEIKKDLKNGRLFIVNRPQNKKLIQSFRTLERDTHANEDKKGPKDKILEGKHHLHAALRYIYQFPISWIAETTHVPEPDVVDELVGW